MKKTTLKTIFTLFVLLLTFAVLLSVTACTNTDTTEDPAEEEETETFTSLVGNGDFSETSGSTQPYSVSSWSTYTTSVTNSEDRVSGIIDTGVAYETAKTAWNSLSNPYGEAKENKLLMIYNKEANVYGYTNSFSTSTAAYYTVSVKAKAVSIEGTGATFRIYTTNGHEEFNITATQDFETYTFYVIAPRTTTTSLTVQLTLGFADDKVKGYVFFDDVVASKISASDYKKAQEDETLTNVKFVSMLQPDGEFDYYSYSSSTFPVTPTSWTSLIGKDAEDKNLNTNYIKRGIISTAENDWTKLSESYSHYFAAEANPGLPEADGDEHILALRAAMNTGDVADKYTQTAIGYESSLSIQIDISTLYELSVWVKASVDEDELHNVTDFTNKGAAVVLRGADTYSMNAIKTNNEKNNGWEKVTFYIFGNEYSAKEFTIELWLGSDEDEDHYTQGVAYFDKLTLTDLGTFTASERDALLTEKNSLPATTDYVTRYKVIDLKSVKVNMVNNHDFSDQEDGIPTGYTFSAVDNVIIKDGDIITAVIPAADLNATEWTDDLKAQYGIDENPSYPYGFDHVLLVNHVIPTAYKVTQTQEIEIKQNLYYRLSLWIKTIGIEDGKTVTIDLKDTDGDNKKTYSVNTANYSNELTNDYAECIFYLKGNNASSVDSKTNSIFVHLEISFGSGTKYDPSSYKKGAYVIADINMEQITATEYSKATTSGDYTSKTDLASNSTTLSNGNFNEYDLGDKKTEIDQDTGLVKLTDEFENNGYYTGHVKDWTNNVDEKYGTTKVEQIIDKDGNKEDVKVNNLIAGIINVNADADYLAQFKLDSKDIFDTWADSVIDETKEKPITFGKPNVLMITTRGEAEVKLKNTYKESEEEDAEEKTNDMTKTPALKSPSISLSANSYYVLKCYARTYDNAVAEIHLTTSSNDIEVAKHVVKDTNGWVEYIFIVETGLSSVNANFELYYGMKGDEDTAYSGTVLFDSFTYTSIDEDKFEEYKERQNTSTAKFTTATFDVNGADSESAVKPSLFSGTGESTSGYTNTDSQVAGVIAKNTYKYENLGIYETKTTTDEETGEDKTEDVIIEGSALDANVIFAKDGITNGEVGNYLLLINNRKDTYYTYETSSLTLAADSYYKFSAYVRTAWLKDKDTTAKVKVTIGDDTYTLTVNTGAYDNDGKETIGEWKLVNFYIKNGKAESSAEAKLAFVLGENSDEGKIKGYLFIDNVSLSSISESEFTTETAAFYDYEKDEAGEDKIIDGAKVLTEANKTYRLSNSVIELKDEETTTDEEDDSDDEDDSGINTTLLWTYITSIAIAAVLIAVIVAWLIRKYRPKKKGTAPTSSASYDRNKKSVDGAPKEDENKTGSARDEYKDE